jgi:dipeptidyl aminopeptidase/acylaminoacyl peptidase
MIERRAFLLPAAFFAIAAAAPAGRPDLGTVLTSLDSVKHFHDVAISPDGARVAWSERVRDAEARESFGAISVADLRSGAARRLTAASDGKPHREWGAEFSPDGKTIAFLSDAEKPPQLQIWTAPAAGGPAKQLTRIEGQLAHLRWAPDGRSIACLFVRGSMQETGALVAHARDSGVVGEIIEEQRIAVADLASGAIREVSPHDLYVYDYDWAPDGRSFAAEAAKGSGTNNYWVAELYVVEAGTGHTRSIWKPALQIACPRFAPDGSSIAVIHGIMSDEGSTGGDVWTVPVAGGAPANLTPEMKASATALFWKPSGELVFSEAVDGEQGVAALEAGKHSLRTLWKGPSWPERLALARDGSSSAVILQSYREAPEAAAGPIGAWKALSHSNAGAKAWWGEAKSLHWKSDGETVQGWLLYPLDFDASKRYPMVVSVHGGPSSDQRLAWPSRWTGAIPSQGYFLFLPNPRGSYGFGEKFTQGNVKDFGGGDLRDILSGVDEALKAAPIDKARLGIIGWSYGGYMTMWAVTQTSRFAAAVAGAGIVDWRSYYGQNKIDTWMLPFFGASVYDDPAVYARSSPIEFIKKVQTPTLVLHGERDSEVPTPQGYEFWHALKALHVETQLVIYPDEGHDIRRLDHQHDIVRRSVGWFDRYLGGKK